MTYMQALTRVVARAFAAGSVKCPFCSAACPNNGSLVLVGHYDHCAVTVLKKALAGSDKKEYPESTEYER